MNVPPQVQEKPRFKAPDTLLKKTEIRTRVIWQKIICATNHLNEKYGEGGWSRIWLFDRMNYYLVKDGLDTLSLPTFDRRKRELNALYVDGYKVWVSIGEGNGIGQGANYSAKSQKDALHLINIYFWKKKLIRQQAQKLIRHREQKLIRHLSTINYLLNQSSVVADAPKVPESPVVVAHLQRRTGTGTDSYQRPSEGSYVYKQALVIKDYGSRRDGPKTY